MSDYEFEYLFCLLSVSLVAPSYIYPSVQPQQVQVIRVEQTLQQVDLEPIRLQPSWPQTERDDDWFALFDAVHEKTVILPSGTCHICSNHIRSYSETLYFKTFTSFCSAKVFFV